MTTAATLMTTKKRQAFMRMLADTGCVKDACAAGGISRDLAYKLRKRDESFAAEWAEALEEAVDALETEARRRAMDGVGEDVYHDGRPVGVKTRYSDVLLIFLLKGARPEKYRERSEVQHSGSASVNVYLPYIGPGGKTPQ